MATANARVLCAVQVETVAGVEPSRRSARSRARRRDGRAGDLAVSMGAPPGSPAHDAAVEKVLTAATAAGRSTGMFCLGPEQVERFARRGVRMLVMGSDAGLLGAAATQARDAAAPPCSRHSAVVSARPIVVKTDGLLEVGGDVDAIF
ncbi:hypothetical protein HBB16_10335 [Pseudonocardia sp. MCCB 268]|nr:hypothetical protein [Pseudonocardia cytotoxica]